MGILNLMLSSSPDVCLYNFALKFGCLARFIAIALMASQIKGADVQDLLD